MRWPCSRRSASGPRYGASAAQALERTLAQALARAPRGRSSAGLGQDAGDDAAAPGLARGVLARGLQPNPDVALRRRADTAGLARREAHGPATARMVADRMARRRARADEILALHPARGHADRSSRRYRETALAHRTRLRGAQERTRPRPLRRAGLARLPSPRHALHRRLWILDPRESGLSDLNNIPIKYINGQTAYMKDVGQVHDGWLVQQNVVREDGRRSVLMGVIKNGGASTLTVVDGVRKVLKIARSAAPPGMSIKTLFDQSKLVTSSITSVVREGAIAAGLTGLMILMFLGSWRSTLIVLISIPLAILTSIVVLYFLGHTLNTMTLGGMALAVGILVDDSTVTIENTHRLRGEGMSLAAATLHGSAGIAVPTLVSTLAISCVFTSVVFLEGPAKFLFTPLGLAVVFAMLASYTLSRTLTPVIIGLLLKGEHRDAAPGSGNWFTRFHQGFERAFEQFRQGYVRALTMLLKRRWIVPVVAALMLALGGVMLNFVGRDFFPAIDGGQIRLHVRAPAATRIETTERIFQQA